MPSRLVRAARALLPATLLAVTPAALRAQAAPAAPAAAAPTASHLAAASQLLDVMNTPQLMRTTAEQMLQGQLQQMPQLTPYAEIIRKFYAETLDWSAIGPLYARLYAETFTEAELREIIAFYQTPIGAKMLESIPQVMARSQQLVSTRVQEFTPRLVERLQAAERGSAAKPGRP